MFESSEVETVATRLPSARRDEGTVCITPWKRSGGRRMTRAHLRLSREPGFVASLGSSLALIERALRKVSGTRFRLEALVANEAPRGTALRRSHCSYAVIELPVSNTRAVLELNDNIANVVFSLGGLDARWPADRLSASEERAFARLLLASVSAIADEPTWKAGFSPRLVAIHRDHAAALAALDTGERLVDITVRVLVERFGVTYLTLVVPSRAIELALLRAPVRRRAGPVPSAIANARTPVSILAGRGFLSLRDLRALRPGDTVEIAGLGWHAGRIVGAARMRTAAFEAHGALFPRGLELSTFNTTVSPEEKPMSDDLSRSLLPIEVEVELTRFNLPLSELGTLRPGAVLPLRQRDEDPVTLKVGGRAIARAELVDIDGEVGARILELIERGGGR